MNKVKNSPIRQILLVLLIVFAAFVLSKYYISTPPKITKKKHHQTTIPTVEVIEAARSNSSYTIYAMGTVIAAEEIELKPRISGEIVSISNNFTPGGLLKKGEEILTIDPQDYKLAIAQRKGDVAQAQAALHLERGKQRVAEKEFQLLGSTVEGSLQSTIHSEEQDLMLRKPQRESARAALLAAEAKLEIAQNDLANTKIYAPFNAAILSKAVDVGSRIHSATTLAKLVGTDHFLLRITLPPEKLRWLNNGKKEEASQLAISLGESGESGEDTANIRHATITTLSAALEEGSKMAVLYASIADPLCLHKENRGKIPLRLGNFVQVTITGKTMENMVAVERSALRTENTLWIVGKDNRLEIRKVTPAAINGEYIYLDSGIEDGERIITSPLDSPSPQMELRLVGEKRAELHLRSAGRSNEQE